MTLQLSLESGGTDVLVDKESGERYVNVYDVLGEGTYGIVYAYKTETGRVLAVKHKCCEGTGVVESEYEYGHPNFPVAVLEAVCENFLIPSVMLSQELQVMAVGKRIEAGPWAPEAYRYFVRTIMQKLSSGWYCCTDFKGANVVWRDGKYELIDLDGLGVVMTREQQVVNCPELANRVATYPIVDTQRWYGNGAMDLVQMWYGGLVSIVGYHGSQRYKLKPLHYQNEADWCDDDDDERAAVAVPLLSDLFGAMGMFKRSIDVELREQREYERVAKQIKKELKTVRVNTTSVAVMQVLRRILFFNETE